MIQSKISKTKKRLSEQNWHLLTVSLGVLSVLCVLIYGIRTVALTFPFGNVSGEIPVMAVPFSDPNGEPLNDGTHKYLSPTTTAIVLNANGDFYFGDLEAFSNKFHLVANKFKINQEDGRPQISRLIDSLHRWFFERASSEYIKNDKILVFLPASTIPMNIVIQAMQMFQDSGHFENIILADGLR